MATLADVQAYSWILPVAAPISFILAWGMGANELSSNWGNVFGSRVLKLYQIVLIAAVFEFIGAIALGSGVASTIRGSILSTSSYANDPEVLMFGMLCVLITASTWIFIANTFGFPISDSQTTVLSLIGVGLATKGWGGIRWDPGMVNIGIAWAVSPPAAAITGFCLFFIFKFLILKHDDAVKRAKMFFPVFVFLILGVNFFFFLFETPLIEDNLQPWMKAVIAISAALFFTLLAQFTYLRWISKKIDQAEAEIAQIKAEEATAAAAAPADANKPEITEIADKEAAGPADVEKAAAVDAEKAPLEDKSPDGTLAAKEGEDELKDTDSDIDVADVIEIRKLDAVEKVLVKNRFTKFLVDDVYHEEQRKDRHLAEVHHAADRYPVGVELMFTHLLIITACFKSFAHGASDVANAAGPLSAIVNILEDGRIDRSSTIPFWTIAMCAAGMSLGILTYGYKPLTMLGVRLTKISPVRGVCIDLAAAAVIIAATYLRIPISTTQVTVCAIMGVGLATGIREKIHWVNFGIIVLGWAITLVFTAVVSFCLTSFGVRSPSIVTP
ncbi:phosphate transporter [Hyaloraphidium curvatum]|nr:phosphate transporter [Hyaloraphidium curvatum]